MTNPLFQLFRKTHERNSLGRNTVQKLQKWAETLAELIRNYSGVNSHSSDPLQRVILAVVTPHPLTRRV